MNSDSLRDPIERRTFVERCARYAFGLTVLPVFAGRALGADKAAVAASIARGAGFGKAKHVIFLELQGGLSHIDSFDPKTGDSKGPGAPLSTNAGFQVTEYLPETAKIADKITVIRSMTAKVGVHANAQYLMRTGYEKRGTIVHPMLGAWAQHYLGPSHKTLPSTVCVNRPANHGNGYFPASFSPLPILDPDQGLANSASLVSADVQTKRLGLLEQLDATFGKKMADENVKAYGDFYDTTMQLMKSSDLKAFDIGSEPAAMRDKYGRTKFGQGCLLARRLVENGVRFVEVSSGGWDMHKQLADSMEDRGGEFDRTFAALVERPRRARAARLDARRRDDGIWPQAELRRQRARASSAFLQHRPRRRRRKARLRPRRERREGLRTGGQGDDRRQLPRDHRVRRGPADRDRSDHAERPSDERGQPRQAGAGSVRVAPGSNGRRNRRRGWRCSRRYQSRERSFLTAPRFFFESSMRCFTPHGRFAFCRRFFSRSCLRAARACSSAEAKASSKRSHATRRFVACERVSCTLTARPVGLWFKVTCVETLFTFCPPGPLLRLKVSSKSSARSPSTRKRSAFQVWNSAGVIVGRYHFASCVGKRHRSQSVASRWQKSS